MQKGWLQPDNPGEDQQRVIARKIISTQILFEVLEQPSIRPTGIVPWAKAFRAYSLTATGTPCVAVLALALVEGQSLKPLVAVGAFLGVLCLQIATNVLNDVEDYRRLIDLPGTAGGSGVIQDGWWTPLQLRNLAFGILGFGAILGLPALFFEPRVSLPIALTAGVGTLLYSAKNFGLKYKALGDVAVILLCGPLLTAGFAIALKGGVTSGDIHLGFSFGLLAMALLHVNNLQDMLLDRSRGVTTLALLLGFFGSKLFLWSLQLSSAVALISGVCFGHLPAIILLGAVVQLGIAVPWLLRVQKASGPESALLSQSRVQAAQIHLIAGVAVVVSLLGLWIKSKL